MRKLPGILTPSRSIAGRLTLWVMCTMLAVFAFITFLIAFTTYGGIYIVTDARYEGLLDNTTERIDNVLNTVEVAVNNTAPEVEENLGQPDKMYDVVKRLLDLNPDISGSAIAFEPDYYAQKGRQYSPYAYRQDSIVKTKQLGTDEYQYHDKEWYKQPKETGKPYWSDPYYDTGGGEMVMATYSLPLADSQGKVYAVLTADISLEWLSLLAHETDSVNNKKRTFGENHAYSFVIGHDGTYIVHPDKHRILNKTFFDDCRQTRDTKDDQLARDMIAGKRGRGDLDAECDTALYFAPVPRAEWSMGIVIPYTDIEGPALIFVDIIFALMLIGLVIVFIVCQITIKRITKPLRRFAHSADEIAQGTLDAPLPIINTKDEMRRLHDSFKTMQLSLIDQIEETRQVNEQKGRIESELRIARNIQMAMLPKTFPPYPNRTDIDIYGQLTPAKEVGGDLYDFYIRDEKLFFCIGDVSGKGVPASLVMAVTRALFRTLSAHESQPAYILSQLNNIMAADNDSNMFVTLLIGVLDLPTGHLRYANAGHDAPLLIAAEGVRVGLLPVDSNIPVGVMDKWKFTSQETRIDPGTMIFLYTDGLTEAEDINHAQFGEDRIFEVAQLPEIDYLPQPFIERMTEAVHTFVGKAEQSDDLTMLAIQYTKQQLDIRLQRSITLPNDVQEVPQLAAFVDEVCETVGFDMSTTMSLNLAIEEAVVNVMNYAYPEGVRGDVNIEAQADDKQLKFTISDRGIPFDPTAKGEVDTTLAAEDRPIGGLGIHLVRQIMDSINYERTDGKNVLTLIKKLEPVKE